MTARRRVIDQSGIDRPTFAGWLIEIMRGVLLRGPSE